MVINAPKSPSPLIENKVSNTQAVLRDVSYYGLRVSSVGGKSPEFIPVAGVEAGKTILRKLGRAVSDSYEHGQNASEADYKGEYMYTIHTGMI